MRSLSKIVYVQLRHIATGNLHITSACVPSDSTADGAFDYVRKWVFSNALYTVEHVSENRWDGFNKRMKAEHGITDYSHSE
jgi:hypothetical protein